jgi:HlyD family secretion protein
VSDQLSHDLASLRIDRTAKPARSGRAFGVLAALATIGLFGAGVAVGYPYVEAQIFKTEVSTTSVAMISPAEGSITLTSTGYVIPQKASKVSAKLPGRIAKMLVAEGDVVKAGQILAELEKAGPIASVGAAKARVNAARARVAAARANVAEIALQVDRQKTLVEKGAAGQASLDDLSARLRALEEAARAADAEVRATEAEIGALQVNVDDLTVRAPIDGTVIVKPLDVGELVGQQTESLTEIADLSSQVVETDVPEARLGQMKVGTPCEIVLDAYPDKRRRGEVVEIGRKVNRAKATVVVKVRFVDGTEGVLPDMSARTSFLTAALGKEQLQAAAKKVVPGAALVERSGAQVVFVIDDDKVRMVPVKLGAAMGSSFELLEGPAEGARLVANPPAVLQDGQAIKEKGKE